ncbi:MAG: hypothetical protein AB7S38_24820 [Vulcanimicrobiota bacterium]
MSGPPSFASEFKRGLNAFNLTVGGVTSVAVALGLYLAAPDLLGLGQAGQATVGGLLTMLLTTGLHTAGHAYFGWRFERGIAAHQRGDHRAAVGLLAVVEKHEMDHFDPEGYALRALQSSRVALEEQPAQQGAGQDKPGRVDLETEANQRH